MYFMPVQILLLILTSFRPHYNPTLVSFCPTLVQHLRPNSDHLQHLPFPTLRDKLRTQMFRKGATHKLKPSPSDITAIGLSNSVIGLPKSLCNNYLKQRYIWYAYISFKSKIYNILHHCVCFLILLTH